MTPFDVQDQRLDGTEAEKFKVTTKQSTQEIFSSYLCTKRFCAFLRISNQNCILRNTTGRKHTSTWWPPSKRQNYDLNILYLIYVVHHIKKSQILFKIYIWYEVHIWAQWSAVVLYPDVLQLQAKKHRPESAMDVPVHIMNWVGLVWKYMENSQLFFFISHRSEKHPTMFVDRE